MQKPLIQIVLLSLLVLNTACGNAKFSGTGSKKKGNKNNEQVVVNPPTPAPTCKPGETCVVVDPNTCKAGQPNCPTLPPDACKVGERDCPIKPPVDDCKANPGKCSNTNPGQNPGDYPGQNKDPNQDK
jgi:hypothetical protein